MSDRTAHRFFLVLLLLSAVLLAAVARPLAGPLFLGAVLAGVLWPLHARVSARFGDRRNLVASVFVFAAVVVLVGPLVSLSAFLVKEATEALQFVSETIRSEGVIGLVEELPPGLQGPALDALGALSRDGEGSLLETLERQLGEQGGRAAVAVGAAVKATGSLVFDSVLMLIALFLFLVHGDAFVLWLDRAMPLERGQTHEILAEFKKVSFSVVISSVVTASVQATAALGGFLIASVPHPIFFASLTFFMAFIPAIGAAVVSLAAALLLWATGHPYWAIFLAIWGVAVVGLVDNVVKPLLIRSGMQMNAGVVFFALLGGLAAFGTIGLLLGPLVVSLFLTLLRIYHRDFGSPEREPPIPGESPGESPGEAR